MIIVAHLACDSPSSDRNATASSVMRWDGTSSMMLSMTDFLTPLMSISASRSGCCVTISYASSPRASTIFLAVAGPSPLMPLFARNAAIASLLDG